MPNLRVIITLAAAATATVASDNRLTALNLRVDDDRQLLSDEVLLETKISSIESDSYSNDGSGVADIGSDLDNLDANYRDRFQPKKPTAISSAQALRSGVSSKTSGVSDSPVTSDLNGFDASNSTTVRDPITKSPTTDTISKVPATGTLSPNATQTTISGATSGSAAITSAPDGTDSPATNVPTETDASTMKALKLKTLTSKASKSNTLSSNTTLSSSSNSTSASNLDASNASLKSNDTSSTLSKVPTATTTPTSVTDSPQAISSTATSSSDVIDFNNSAITSVGSDSKNSTFEDPSASVNSSAGSSSKVFNLDVSLTNGTEDPSGKTDPTTVFPSPNSSKTGKVSPVAAWKQCGGFGFDYSKYLVDGVSANWSTKLSCTEGYSCKEVDAWYFQCQPTEASEPVEMWGQCGGDNHIGTTDCISGSVCKYVNEWYSQCTPA